MSNLYNTNFYDIIRPGVLRSVEAIVPFLYGLVKPQSVIDVGCGEGHWAVRFQDYGCSVLGVDGAYVSSSPLGENFIARDISQPFSLSVTADLVVCLEVAEHLPEKRAAGFISDLVKLGPTILFSAAIPRQSGAGHINCQWPSYWKSLFADHGYEMSGSIRDRFWDDDKIEPWYRQNLMLVTSAPGLYPEFFPDTTELNRVHPIIRSWWS